MQRQAPPPEVIAKARRHFAEAQRRDRERIALYGKVRPEIAIDFKGQKIVAVGSKLFRGDAKKLKYFPNFLLEYLTQLFGTEWFEAESQKSADLQHPAYQWGVKGTKYMNRQARAADGSYRAVPSGFLAAYLALGYDAYVVEHNGSLDENLLARLKHRDQFQGARHELFAEATCYRAGFDIEHEDERDGSHRHAEFNAIHKATGQRLAVEAKSRHRAGVLAQPGQRQGAEKMSLRYGALLNDAVEKVPDGPLGIFLDTNLPVSLADKYFSPTTIQPFVPSRYVELLIGRLQKEHGGKDPWNMIVFTNHPHHYADEDELDPRKHLLSIRSNAPKNPLEHPEALAALHEAAGLYGNIPNKFPRR